MQPKSRSRKIIIVALIVLNILGVVGIATAIVLPKLQIGFYQRSATFLLTGENVYRVNRPFKFRVDIHNVSEPINLVVAQIDYDKDVLEVKQISTDKSFANIFTHNKFDNTKGELRVIGGLANPGFFSEKGHFVTITFVPKTTGSTTIAFNKNSKILANDGLGTNISSTFVSAKILITE